MALQNNRINTLLGFLEEDQGDSFVRFALAKEYEKSGLLKEALDTFIELQKRDPDYVGLYYHLGALYENLSDKSSAKETYDLGIAVTKKAADFHALSELHTARTNIDIESV